MSMRSDTIEERVALLRQPHSPDPPEPTPMRVGMDQIKGYDRNPRRERNQAYKLIKHSLRQRGFRGTRPITRRPGDEMLMVAEGGNTVFHPTRHGPTPSALLLSLVRELPIGLKAVTLSPDDTPRSSKP
ncbi:MAG: hypothetical protein ACREYE_32840 [Gammaproteobacteria bacterium]